MTKLGKNGKLNISKDSRLIMNQLKLFINLFSSLNIIH